MADSGANAKGFEFRKFATPRIIGGIVIVVVVLWALSMIFSSSDSPTPRLPADRHDSAGADHRAEGSMTTAHAPASTDRTPGQPTAAGSARQRDAGHGAAGQPSGGDGSQATTAKAASASHGDEGHGTSPSAKAAVSDRRSAAHQPSASSTGHGAAPASRAADRLDTGEGHPLAPGTPLPKPIPKGVAFVEATIAPLRYELEDRWWGWRPNDLINVTDNVNTFQMGVLEVTRRTVVALAERISRHGVTDALDPNLEDAMNWFMVKASSYWFPSAESKYREGLEELEGYLNRLKEGKATFYTRTDNLIPLLASFEDLLGSCDENLVKQFNEDGSEVSIFAADDYFFYTQGVVSAMATVLEAVHHDFLLTLESRHATELLHHAIVSCRQATDLDPWIILDRDLSSIFANHRANMAAPVSHARFYLGQLVKTLST